MPGTHLTTSGLLVQGIGSSLHRKIWRLGHLNVHTSGALVCLEDGGGLIEADGRPHTLEAPTLFWLNRSDGCRLITDAGTTGYLAEMTEDIVTRALGDFPETATLKYMIDHDHHFAFDRNSANGRAISSGFLAMLSELQSPQNGMEMLLVAYLRIVLVSVMRMSGAQQPQHARAGSSRQFLHHFRRLVEDNFLAHWPIARYADQIGISHDRLHAICRRELEMTPKALVAERLAREAGHGLERSTLTIEQLSHSLGFRDPAHFSHFFKRMTGMAPGQFRQIMSHSSPDGPNTSPTNFADWP
ncbi:MAG: helix-turn-helix domain-containing protein [Rhizobiaceae bacterium]|nr:helix-turn-helix domain-containing protein [Rhizobiaceae bacterium]